MSHSCVENYLHIIFATKNRDSLIPLEIELRLHSYFAGIAKKKNVPILKINGTDDHIHMLIKLHPLVALGILMRDLKSYSTSWLKKEGSSQFSWQEGYGAFSCSESHLKPLANYIENQKEHHRNNSFKSEVANLNRIWGTSWIPD
jgi:REP element-mobilizing transposase RayT